MNDVSGPPATPEELAKLSAIIDSWTGAQRENGVVADVEVHPEDRRWIVRIRGEEKVLVTVWLTLRERTLHYETYFMPAPEENVAECYEYLLRANLALFGMRFAIGGEDAIYLVGQMPLSALEESELDRIVGSIYAYSERYFAPAMSIGHRSRFRAH